MWAKGKTAWVTGGSSGIGEGLVHEMIRAGANVVLSARTESDLASLADDIGMPERALVLPLDMREPAGYDDAVRAVRALPPQRATVGRCRAESCTESPNFAPRNALTQSAGWPQNLRYPPVRPPISGTSLPAC